MFNKKENMNVQVENISKKIMELSIGKKSFGSFFLPSPNKKIMEILPYLQQTIWGVPINKEKTIFWEYHKDMKKINDYDFAIIFTHEESNENKILFKKSNQFKNTYKIIIRTSINDFPCVQSPIYYHLMKYNKFIKGGIKNDFYGRKGKISKSS